MQTNQDEISSKGNHQMLNTKSNSKAKKTNVNAIKMAILASSLAITVGGWGVLAAGQLQSATATQVASTQSSTTNTQQRLSQLAASQVSAAPRAITRTRSSR